MSFCRSPFQRFDQHSIHRGSTARTLPRYQDRFLRKRLPEQHLRPLIAQKPLLLPYNPASYRSGRESLSTPLGDLLHRLRRDRRDPLTGAGVVTRIYTDLAVIDVTPDGLRVRDMIDGMTLTALQARTGAPLRAG